MKEKGKNSEYLKTKAKNVFFRLNYDLLKDPLSYFNPAFFISHTQQRKK